MSVFDENAEIWRSWGRSAPAGALSDFLSRFDAGRTELRAGLEEPKRKGCVGRFVVEIHELEEDELLEEDDD